MFTCTKILTYNLFCIELTIKAKFRLLKMFMNVSVKEKVSKSGAMGGDSLKLFRFLTEGVGLVSRVYRVTVRQRGSARVGQ